MDESETESCKIQPDNAIRSNLSTLGLIVYLIIKKQLALNGPCMLDHHEIFVYFIE
jgi:hypothetical protein